MKRSIIVVACLSAALAVSALPGGFLPRTGDDERLRFSVSNDAMGPGPVDEWDDLRSFRVGLTIALKAPLVLSTEYQSFTWRSDSPSSAARIDSVNVLLGSTLFDSSAWGLRFLSRGSLGASLVGELGGAILQEGFHGTVGLARPLPTSYDAYSCAALALSVSAEAALENGRVRPAIFGSVDGDLPGSWRLQAGARADIGGPGCGAAAWALYRYESPSGVSPTLDAVSRFATGAVVGLAAEASYLTSSMELNLSEGVSNGAIGFRIGTHHGREAVNGIPIALEIHNDFVRFVTGYRMLFPLFGPSVRILAGATIGWWNLPGSSATGLRSSEYTAGLEGRLTVPLGRLEGEIACALAPVAIVITVQPLSMERSRVQDCSVLLGMRFEPAVRIGFVEPLGGGRIRKTGLGTALALEPPAWALRSFSSWPAASNRALALRIFAFGEIR